MTSVENLIFGTGAIARGLSFTIKNIMQYQLFWGFALGFLISTLVHGFLVSDNPKQIPTMLFHNNTNGFLQINQSQRNPDGTYTVSFSKFIKMADKVRFLFGFAFFIFFIIILVALLKF